MNVALTQVLCSLNNNEMLTPDGLIDEKELENVLQKNIALLDEGWFVIGRQVQLNKANILDLLCIDKDQNLVVVELKKNLTPRNVTAQVIEYASYVSEMTADEINTIYQKYSQKYLSSTVSLSDAYYEQFGVQLVEETLNQKVKMVIVAAEMDDGTKHIIDYLRDTYKVDINILFFKVFKNSESRVLSRIWFKEDLDLTEEIEKSETNHLWNGEYYISFGTGKNETRKWEDAVKYGFISAGGGLWYTRTLKMLHKGARIWVNIPHKGYVGVGIVQGDAVQANEADLNGKSIYELQSSNELSGEYLYSLNEPDNAEFLVPVKWIKTISEDEAIREVGFFGNQNSVCRPTAIRWQDTVNRLKKLWNIE